MTQADQPPTPKCTPNPRGLYCPDCRGVRLFVVKYRRPIPGRVVRRRECSACGLRVTTEEKIIRVGTPGSAGGP